MKIAGLDAITAGRGKPLLALHGYGSCKESFLRQINFLSAFRLVVAVDMSGFGKSPPLTYPYTLDDYAAEIKRVLDEIGASSVDLLAHSFGARVAVRLLGNEKRIENLIFTGAAGLTPKRNFRYVARRASFLLLKKFVPRNKLLRFYSRDYREATPIMRESFKFIVSERLDEEYARVENRTLLIFGEKDDQTPLASAKKMHRLMRNSSLVVLKNAGHFCFVDKPSEFNGEALKFLFGRG